MKRTRWMLSLLLPLATTLLARTRLGVQVPEVPEPGTILLMGAGLAGLGYFGWRRNRNK